LKTHPLLALALVPLIPWTQAGIDRRAGAGSVRKALYLRSGEQMKRLSDGFSDLLADVYWLRTVQYFGSQRVFGDSRFELLQPLVEITTRLDPRLEIAYRYGATFLAEPYPAGAGDPQAAIEILERGVENVPHSWRLRQDLALFHYFFLGDAPTASRILLEAAERPGMPSPIFRTLAADLLAQRGHRETSRTLWRRLYDEADPGPMKENAALHLRQLDALEAVDAYRRAAEAYRAQAGRWPSSLEELRRAGLIQGGLVDPAGTPFDYNPETGQASVARASPLWRRNLGRVNR